MRAEIRQALSGVPPEGMTRFIADGVIRFMTPLAAKCMRNNLLRTYKRNHADLTGEKFNKLRVIRLSGSKDQHLLWLCICDCGEYRSISTNALVSGGTRSCGCGRGRPKAVKPGRPKGSTKAVLAAKARKAAA